LLKQLQELNNSANMMAKVCTVHTDKKKRKFPSYIRTFRMEQSYMRKGFLIYEI
jgi:hypothetical protein